MVEKPELAQESDCYRWNRKAGCRHLIVGGGKEERAVDEIGRVCFHIKHVYVKGETGGQTLQRCKCQEPQKWKRKTKQKKKGLGNKARVVILCHCYDGAGLSQA